MQNTTSDHGGQELYNFIIRVSKAASSFVYFTFESNEGICFYSTLPSSMNQDYRDVTIYMTPEFKEDVERILQILSHKFEVQYLSKELIKDSL